MEERFRLEVVVAPHSRHDGLSLAEGGALRARVSAPPTEGRANAALTLLLARALGVPPTAIAIVRGRRGRRKLVEVSGIAPDEGRRRLRASLSPDAPEGRLGPGQEPG